MPRKRYYKNNPNAVISSTGKYIGKIDGKAFVKEVYGHKDMLQKPRGWATDADSFDDQVRPYADRIIIIDKDNGIEYHSSIQHFNQNKGEINRGHGRQYYMVISKWDVIRPGEQRPLQLSIAI